MTAPGELSPPRDLRRGQDATRLGRDVLEFIERVEALSLFQERIAKPSCMPQVWAAFREEIERLVVPRAVALYRVDPRTCAFELNQWSPEDCETVCRREIDAQIECGTFAWIVNRRQPAIIPSLAFKESQNLVMLPLTTHTQTLGVAMIVSAIEDKSVTHERLRLMGILSKQCALVMENTLLFGHLQEEHQALQKAQAQIIQAEKFAGIGRLTSGAFHELLNPLNVISGHLQIMMLAEELPPSVGANLPVMKSAADRIAAIVNSLLQFSAKRPETAQSIEVEGLLHGVVDEKTAAQPGCPIAVTFSIVKPLPPVWVAEEDLKTVVRHLVDNACEAMPHGGRLTIGAHVAAGAAETEPLLEISVADNGTGIAASDTHKVFDPFFTTKDIGQGTGLSLAVSYALVRSMGGTLSFERLDPQGTVFRIRLPLTRPRQTSPQ